MFFKLFSGSFSVAGPCIAAVTGNEENPHRIKRAACVFYSEGGSKMHAEDAARGDCHSTILSGGASHIWGPLYYKQNFRGGPALGPMM